MPITRLNDETGVEEVFYTEAEKLELETKIQELETKNRDLGKNNSNLRRLAEMTEEEKSHLSQAELENRQEIERLQAVIEEQNNRFSQAQQDAIERARTSEIAKYVGSDETLKAKFLEQYGILNIDEKDSDSIARRAELAAKLAGITTPEAGTNNPIHAYWEGESPTLSKEKDEFAKSDKAKAAFEAMGFNPDGE